MAKRTQTSGIIAAYNQERYIGAAVLSLAGQVDELVVIDDCSTDETVNVIEAMKLPNVLLLRNDKNLGVSRSLNIAVEAAHGLILVLSGGDDISLPGRVQRQVEEFSSDRSSELGFVFSRPTLIDEHGAPLPDDAGAEFLFRTTAHGLLSDLVLTGNFICAPSVAVRRQALQSIGGFHPDLLYTQDHDVWIRILSAGYAAKELTEPDVAYRKHTTNLSRAVPRRSTEPKNLRQYAELDFIISDFFRSASKDVLTSLASKWGYDPSGLSRTELEVLVSFAGGNLFASRSGLRSYFTSGRSEHIGVLSELNADELAGLADVLSILEKRSS